MNTKYAIALLTLVGVVGSAQAAWQGRAHWIGGASSVYYDAANWLMEAGVGPVPGQNFVPANVPGLEYDMMLDNSASVVLNQDTLVNIAHLGGASWAGGAAPSDVTLTINGGNIETIWWMVLGEQFGSSGTINMNGGTLTVGTHPTDVNDLMIGAHNGGSGTFNMNAGTVTADQLIVGFNVDGADVSQQVALLNLYGGTVNAGILLMNAQGLINITDGQLNINGDVTTNINAWVSGGQIVATGGVGGVQNVVRVNYNAGLDVTEVTAVSIPLIGNIAIENLGAGNLALTWDTGLGFNYVLLEKTSLLDLTWSTNMASIAGGETNVTVTVPASGPAAFYKVTSE